MVRRLKISLQTANVSANSGHKVNVATFKSSEKADAVIKSSIVGAADLMKGDGFTVYTWSLRNLGSWLRRLEMGSKVDDRSPLFDRKPRNLILADFEKKFNTNFSWGTTSTPSSVTDFYLQMENEFKGKVGPMSLFKPWTEDGPEKVAHIWADKPPLPALNRLAMDASLRKISSLLPIHSIHLDELSTVLAAKGGNPKFALDITTNGCYPVVISRYVPSPGESKDSERSLAFKVIWDTARMVYETAFSARDYRAMPRHDVAIVSQRTNVMKGPDPLSSPKSKRVVIAKSKCFNTVPGKAVMNPIQRVLKRVYCSSTKTPLILGWHSSDMVDVGCQRILHYAAKRGLSVLSGDISNFDASLPPWLMWEVAQAISTWLDKPAANLFLSIVWTDIYGTWLITPDKIWQPHASSVKSGSIFTSLIGCIANLTIQLYGHYAGYYSIESIAIMGDDFIGVGPGYNEENISRPFSDVGMEANPSKQVYASGFLTFLKRMHVLNVPGGIYSVYNALGKVLGAEDDRHLNTDERNVYGFTFKTLAQLQNAALNPNFAELVGFVRNGSTIKNHQGKVVPFDLGAALPPSLIAKRAGSVATKFFEDAKIKPWTDHGHGLEFDNWLVNRVLRGATVPPLGEERFKAVYGRSTAESSALLDKECGYAFTA